MNTYCGTGLANPRNPRGLTLAWDHNVYANKEISRLDVDDNKRPSIGLAVTLRDMGDGASRIYFDDIVSEKDNNPKSWEFESFFTFSTSFENEKLDQLELDAEDYARIGENIVMRLLALHKRVK